MKRLVAALSLLALAVPAPAMAKGQFHPESEFELHPWVSIHLGPLDMSINKAVVYLLMGALLTILLAWFLLRFRLSTEPGHRQTIGEWVYDIAQVQVAEQGLPHKAMRMWFPYVFALMLFIWTVNILGFIPLPLTGETWHGIPVWGIYAATSQLSVTLALALLSFVFTHVEGVRYNGARHYFSSWMPAGMPKFTLKWAVPLTLLYLLEVLGQFMRLISLSVRLFANMLAGHILILTFIGLIFVSEQVFTAVALVPLASVFYLFEVLIVVSIQAFIFAALTAIYIGSAIEPEH
ncbi:MAG: F0F1 ATP synthase subunit A [Gaiellaceae bacterium]